MLRMLSVCIAPIVKREDTLTILKLTPLTSGLACSYVANMVVSHENYCLPLLTHNSLGHGVPT